MPSDYAGIRAANVIKYGTDIGRYGPMLLAERYDDRTHFIFELLQNAEDAFSRRKGWKGSRAVKFDLGSMALQVSHYGQPFDARDVQGICGIADSSKDLTAIGRFGIGFKSVYAYTSQPEIHSGDEDFAIDSFVLPSASPAIHRNSDETVIILPLTASMAEAHSEITSGLQRLGPATLLFLRQIDEIEWRVAGGPSGIYMRSEGELLGEGVRRIVVIGQEAGRGEVSESWLIFSQEVQADDGVAVGYIEIAFSILEDDQDTDWSIQPVGTSQLVVFFPTVVSTNLGFLIQGPYRTTPSRDNVPKNDAWNQALVKKTASLLMDALEWLRNNRRLDVSGLRCLPLDRSRFPEGSMFAQLFESVRAQFKLTPLLPSSSGGYVQATSARLARTQELRQLLNPNQLGILVGSANELEWLTSEISIDRTPEIRQYVMRELDVPELTPEMILARLSGAFLQAQTDEWIASLYEFLQGQPALVRGGRIENVPIIRLSDGTQVLARSNGEAKAFLPSGVETQFPTVRKSVCQSKEARKFLESLGLTIPDPVDDVIWNVLPKYRGVEVDVTDEAYQLDIRRILDAFQTDSKTQREKLISALRDTSFVMAVDAGDGSKWVSKPEDVYLATAKLKALFSGVKGVQLVDDEYECLRGEEVRDLLEACGASRYLQTVPIDPEFSWQQRREMRIGAGCESNSGADRFTDYSFRGLNELMASQKTLDLESQKSKGQLLWEALIELQERRSAGAFTGQYHWFYFQARSATFDSYFVRRLNDEAWVPDSGGHLQKPCRLAFERLGWRPHPFLQSKIKFKPPIIEILAKEAGLEPGVLDLLKTLGVTSESDLRARLGMGTQSEPVIESNAQNTEGSGSVRPSSERREPFSDGVSVQNVAADEVIDLVAGETSGTTSSGENNEHARTEPDKAHSGLARHGAGVGTTRPFDGKGGRTFISYIATHADGDEMSDPDSLDSQARFELEEKAIKIILSSDSRLERTPRNNPGFDLFESDSSGHPIRWVEVKAMTGGLADRPVCLSRAQFDCAWLNGEAYWIYVVEHAGDTGQETIVRIQDPAGKAQYFAFDQGWRKIANIVSSL